MRLDRRELLRQFGVASAASALLTPTADLHASTSATSARIVHLNNSESAYGASKSVKSAICDAAMLAGHFPGDEAEDLRPAIATLHGVTEENITLGCGSREIFRMAAETCLSPGKNLVLASPTYNSMANAASLLGAEVRRVQLTSTYGHDLDAMIARADASTGLFYICNPNNPTATITPKSDFEPFFDKLPGSIPILIDEAYHEYVAPTGAYTSWVARAANDPRLIVTRTFSKAYGLAGLRVGYAVSSPEMARKLSTRSLPMSVNVCAARAARAALSDQAYVKKIASLNANDRQEFYNQANARMLRSLDSETNFVLLNVGRSGQEVVELLSANGVLVAADFPAFQKYIRVSLGLPDQMHAFWRTWDACMPHHIM